VWSGSDGVKQKVREGIRRHSGTYVFDADRSREGYHLNMFCMSLMKAENRKAFKKTRPGISTITFRS
jgi:hypothetical protein